MSIGASSGTRRGRGRLTPTATINVTSLLDITMVLLISFMIVAPTLQSGLTVDLPEVEDSTALEVKDTAVVLSVAAGGTGGAVRVMLDDEEVSIEDLRKRLESLRQTRPKVALVLQGDKAVPWEEMAQVIGAVQASGLPGMSLVTTPPTETE